MQRYYSNIYWHFTGSPSGLDWHKVRKPKDVLNNGSPKTTEQSIEILKKILESNQLLATCTEKIDDGLITDKFCCVTDIPLKDLLGHKAYYGDVAIGFKPDVIQRSFLPVLYIPTENLPVIEEIRVNNPNAAKMAYEFLSYQGGWSEQQGMRLLSQSIRTERKVDNKQVQGFLMSYLKVTDFGINEEDSFYREREWRHINDFKFKNDDITAIVVPKEFITVVSRILEEYKYPNNISIISWDLIELS